MANEDGKGHIDACTNGRLEGWAKTHTASQAVTLQIDGSIRLPVVADRYRLDLERAGILDGHASFSEPLNPLLLDGATHLVELLDSESGKRLAKAEILFEKLEKLEKLSLSLLSCSHAVIPAADQKVAILCGFEKTTLLSKATEASIRNLKQRGFFVVFVLAVDRHRGPRYLDGCSADLIMVRSNVGYDFGSWACALLKLRQMGLVDCRSLLLINDSIIWTGKPIAEKFFDLKSDAVEYDVVGAVESRERKRHLQSYFLHFSARIVSGYRIDEFLLYSGSLSNKKDEIISIFELSTCSFFEDRGFLTHAVNTYGDLLSSFVSKYANYFSGKTRETRSSDLNVEERFLLTWVNAINGGRAVNPSHVLWKEILESGFPFMKKELLFRNPVNVPFYSSFQDEFDHSGVELLHDSAKNALDAFFPFTRSTRQKSVASADISA